MSVPYTGDDARFDAEAMGRCGVCGREVSVCGHCKECGGQGGRHARYCSQRQEESHTAKLERFASTPREDGSYPSDEECDRYEAKLTQEPT